MQYHTTVAAAAINALSARPFVRLSVLPISHSENARKNLGPRDPQSVINRRAAIAPP